MAVCNRCGGFGRLYGGTTSLICLACNGTGQQFRANAQSTSRGSVGGIGIFGLIGAAAGLYFFWSESDSLLGLVIPASIGACTGAMLQIWLVRTTIGRWLVRLIHALVLVGLGLFVYEVFQW